MGNIIYLIPCMKYISNTFYMYSDSNKAEVGR